MESQTKNNHGKKTELDSNIIINERENKLFSKPKKKTNIKIRNPDNENASYDVINQKSLIFIVIVPYI